MPELSPIVVHTPYTRLSIDVETRSACDLPKAGSYAYARHPSTDCLVACYAFDDEEPRTWVRGDPVPPDLADYVEHGQGLIRAFNAPFEKGIWDHVLGPRYGWPVPPLERYICTAAEAAAMSLPRRLGQVVGAVGLEEEKDEGGRRIMMQLSRPRSKPGEPLRWYEPEDVPEKFARLYSYCANDVVIERAASKRLRQLSPEEREIWLETCRMNERGLPIDLVAVHDAIAIMGKAADALNREIGIVTRNRVSSISQVAALKDWLHEQGVDVESLDKAGVREALLQELEPNVRRALEIRQEAAKSSTAKLKSFVTATCPDGRLRGSIRYHGAGTGRDSGEIIQPQNFPRPTLSAKDVTAAIEGMRSRDPAWLDLWGSPLSVISSCLRGMIRAPEGQLIYSGDLSNIEGRVAAWLAGEHWKLQAFRDYDAKTGPDLYIVSAAGIYGVPVDSIDADDERRQLGKVSELSLQFQGGHGAFITMGANYQMTPDLVTAVVRPTIPATQWQAVAERYDPANRYDLPLDQWTALRIVIDAWRAKHPAIVQAWAGYEAAAISAVREPGRAFSVPAVTGAVSYAMAGGVLWCRLPDGKLIAYPDPKMRETETPWGSTKMTLTYMSLNSMTKQWERTKAYGGLVFQNAVQASARQVIMKAQLRFKGRGWPTITRVHDELVCALPPTVELSEFLAELSICPPEFAGLPIAAKAGRALRYGK